MRRIRLRIVLLGVIFSIYFSHIYDSDKQQQLQMLILSAGSFASPSVSAKLNLHKSNNFQVKSPFL